MTPLPTLRQLQFFMALVRRESFSKAAEDCLVSQSTLSSAIKEMEALLDKQLVDRTTRAFALTPTGIEVATRAPLVLAAAEDMAFAAVASRPLEGEFHLGVIPTIAPFLVPALSARLHDAFPKLRLYLREDLTDALIERLSAGLIDAAILALPYDIPGAESIEISTDPFWFVCSHDHPLATRDVLSPADLTECELLLLEDGHCLRDHAIDACGLAQRRAGDNFAATSLLTLTEMARAGIGATLLPDMAIASGIAQSSGLSVIPFTMPRPERKIGIAWRRGSSRVDEANEIAAIAKQCF